MLAGWGFNEYLFWNSDNENNNQNNISGIQKHTDRKYEENTINGHKMTRLGLSQDEISKNDGFFQSQTTRIIHKKNGTTSLHLLQFMKQLKTTL